MKFNEQLKENVVLPLITSYGIKDAGVIKYLTDLDRELKRNILETKAMINFRTSDKYTCIAYLTTQQNNIVDATPTVVKLDTVAYNTGSCFNVATYAYTVPVDGRYFVAGQINYFHLNACGTSNYHCILAKNSWVNIAQKLEYTEQTANCIVNAVSIANLVKGDTVFLGAYLYVGGLNVVDIYNGIDRTFLCVKLIG